MFLSIHVSYLGFTLCIFDDNCLGYYCCDWMCSHGQSIFYLFPFVWLWQWSRGDEPINTFYHSKGNKANLRDLIAVIGLVISCPNWIQIADYSTLVTLKFDGWPRKTISNILHAPRNYVCNFTAIHELKLELPSGNAEIWTKSAIFLLMWTGKDDLGKQRAPPLFYFRLYAYFVASANSN